MKKAILATAPTLLGLLALSATADVTSDGVTTVDPTPAEVPPTYPPLPPNSDDLVYDGGDFTGQSRNLQNAGIHPGWSYWAHQVRFTPTAAMQGELLEVRYVASSQWGATKDFDLYLRDSGGNVITSQLGVTAVTDASNWQVLDVSGLDFTPAANGPDFYVELRPSSACGGTNGFTIAYSSLGSGRSAFSSDCNNPFASFVVEGRDLFVRAVVELTPGGGSGSASCSGDSSANTCPCITVGAAGHGCPNSGSANGARLVGSGTASITGDTFSLAVTEAAFSKPGLVLSGTADLSPGLNNIADSAGLLCVGGATQRGDVVFTDGAGAASLPDFQGVAYGQATNVTAGSPSTYQYWFRDPGTACAPNDTPAGDFNFSNMWSVTWLP